jgi:hypothetical protein
MMSTIYTSPEDTVTPSRFAWTGCQDSDNTRVAGSKNWYVESGVREKASEEKRKSWRHPVDPATARRVGS